MGRKNIEMKNVKIKRSESFIITFIAFWFLFKLIKYNLKISEGKLL